MHIHTIKDLCTITIKHLCTITQPNNQKPVHNHTSTSAQINYSNTCTQSHKQLCTITSKDLRTIHTNDQNLYTITIKHLCTITQTTNHTPEHNYTSKSLAQPNKLTVKNLHNHTNKLSVSQRITTHNQAHIDAYKNYSTCALNVTSLTHTHTYTHTLHQSLQMGSVFIVPQLVTSLFHTAELMMKANRSILTRIYQINFIFTVSCILAY